MYKFSKRSADKLATCHPDLQKVMNEVIKHYDITILEGVRTVERQRELVEQGKSKTMRSKHLSQLDGYSHAVDVALWPIDWNDREKWIMFAGFVKGVAAAIGVKITSGIDWDDDMSIKDHSFFDGPHFQLKVK